MKLYHLLTKSVRAGDLDLFIYCLPKLTNFFFTLNRFNYARWLVWYNDHLLKVSNTHPAILQDFKNGFFAIKQTNKSFWRSPTDLTLEQTINADAACQRRGIIALPNSISARQRWAQSHSLRTIIISYLFEFVGISKKKDTWDDHKRSKIKKNSEDVQQIITATEGTMDPFSADLDKNELFNISSDLAVTHEITASLLKIR